MERSILWLCGYIDLHRIYRMFAYSVFAILLNLSFKVLPVERSFTVEEFTPQPYSLVGLVLELLKRPLKGALELGRSGHHSTGTYGGYL